MNIESYKTYLGVMTLSDKQWELFDFVKHLHQDQQRKYTDEPYFAHLLRVVEILNQFGIQDEEIEIGLCHDLLEKTSCTHQKLASKLVEIGYEMFPRNKILKGVSDMTNIYTAELYPDLSRIERKQMEAERLVDIEPFSQTVKYAELIDNIPSIAKYDKEFAWIYLEEIAAYIGELNEGDRELYLECRRVLDSAINSLVQ